MADERHNGAFMVGIVLGSLAGGIGTLLLTPLSGRQTREQLGARGGLRGRRGRVPDHLDRGTYARVDFEQVEDDEPRRGGVDITRVVASLGQRGRALVAEGGPLAGVAARARGMAGGAGGRDVLAPGEVITFSPADSEPIERAT